MASPNWRQSASVAQQLHEQPYRFNFFQAVRLLEAMHHEYALHDAFWGSYPVGYDYAPEKETVIFKPVPSLQFPSTQITQLTQRRMHDDYIKPAEMLVTFMGLTGPAGVLPTHYTRMLMSQERARDHALRDFFDLFNHRLISFFYRAWCKYRLFIDFERKRRQQREDDVLTKMLRSYIGLQTQGLHNRLGVPDDALLFYAGLLSRSIRSSIGLEGMLSDYFQVPVSFVPLQGRMLELRDSQLTRLPLKNGEQGQFNCLGVNTVLSNRVHNCQNRFKLRIGPLSPKQFADFLPDGTALKPLIAMVEMYVGPEFDFDIQLILDQERTPPRQLGIANGPRLAWDSWLHSNKRVRELDDVVLSVSK
jgi:type VI secretion system protein ImpH